MNTEEFHELVYGPRDVEKKILAKFPQARIRDASDGIHVERFEVNGDIDALTFYRQGLKEGWLGMCFKFELAIGMGGMGEHDHPLYKIALTLEEDIKAERTTPS